jgi:hypothetical protein
VAFEVAFDAAIVVNAWFLYIIDLTFSDFLRLSTHLTWFAICNNDSLGKIRLALLLRLPLACQRQIIRLRSLLSSLNKFF